METHLKPFSAENVPLKLPDLEEFYVLAQKTIHSLPHKFKKLTNTLFIHVQNFPNFTTLAQLKLNDKYDLLGLYNGIPVPLRLTESYSKAPNIIYLYRCPLIFYAYNNQQSIQDLVHKVMIHEIGHHFGYKEFDLSWVENNLS